MATPAHGQLCPNTYSSYCLNGGTCYILRTSYPFCWCDNSFQGSRCEEFLLPSRQSHRTISPSLIIVIVGALIIVFSIALCVAYFFCRKWRQKRNNQRNTSLYYAVTARRAINVREILSVRSGIKKQDVDSRPV
ncbi:pro-neuregulin-4, membrane-bound isoform-like [Stegostoma tigrinum]|uniref:pro-neuregulin-4, membrane-bound isoform-like n=1 Tax=Stegostoma tigrinum TaxID=3053191 RepID=UPI0028704EDE|nr:pro-neuregulin-4, membrane-bound isoform-like [Stegostoma tigrinum]XP_059496176.1 pro-neuregulin-4, membrane-bound isoform-like [Stegostoma tigrinum]